MIADRIRNLFGGARPAVSLLQGEVVTFTIVSVPLGVDIWSAGIGTIAQGIVTSPEVPLGQNVSLVAPGNPTGLVAVAASVDATIVFSATSGGTTPPAEIVVADGQIWGVDFTTGVITLSSGGAKSGGMFALIAAAIVLLLISLSPKRRS